MNPVKSWVWLVLVATLILSVSASAGLSEGDLKRVGYDQHLGSQIGRDLVFQDSSGERIAMGDILNQKPTLLVLGYYHCPMLCTLINDGLIEALQELRLNVGRDFNIVNLSIDPNETAEIAAAKKREYLRRYGRPGAANGWHFLTGSEETIAQLANESGFRFKLDSDSHEYAHPSGFIVLTPDGRISRYFFGVSYDPHELQSAIITAARGERGSLIQQLVLLCCRYSPLTGKYGNVILSVLRVLGAATVVLLVGWIVSMLRRESMQAR